MKRFRRANIGGHVENPFEKADRIREALENSPFHQKNEYGESGIGQLAAMKGYRWMLCTSLLKRIDNENAFDEIVNSKYFTDEEKNYILFNLHRLKELSELNYLDFILKMKSEKTQKQDEE